MRSITAPYTICCTSCLKHVTYYIHTGACANDGGHSLTIAKQTRMPHQYRRNSRMDRGQNSRGGGSNAFSSRQVVINKAEICWPRWPTFLSNIFSIAEAILSHVLSRVLQFRRDENCLITEQIIDADASWSGDERWARSQWGSYRLRSIVHSTGLFVMSFPVQQLLSFPLIKSRIGFLIYIRPAVSTAPRCDGG